MHDKNTDSFDSTFFIRTSKFWVKARCS